MRALVEYGVVAAGVVLQIGEEPVHRFRAEKEAAPAGAETPVQPQVVGEGGLGPASGVSGAGRSSFRSHAVGTCDGLNESRFADPIVADEYGHWTQFETIIEELRDRGKRRGPHIPRQKWSVGILAHRAQRRLVSRHAIILPESARETVRPTVQGSPREWGGPLSPLLMGLAAQTREGL